MISTSNLSKYYDTYAAVRDVSLYIPAGEVCALVGPNGAGKTTLMKMLAGLLRPTSGQMEVDRVEVGAEPKKLHALVGYVPDTFGLYDDMPVYEFLDYFARAHLVDKDKVDERIRAVLDITNLTEKTDAMSGSLSRGMRQRLVIAKTLLPAPKVLLLDEPANGLDPLARIELRDLIRQLAAIGTTLVVSSHILTELADFSTSVIIMERGRVVRAGKVAELVAQLSAGTPVRVEWVDAAAAERGQAWLTNLPTISDVNLHGQTLDFAFAGDRAALVALHRDYVMQADGIVSFYERRFTVEDVFMAANRHQTA